MSSETTSYVALEHHRDKLENMSGVIERSLWFKITLVPVQGSERIVSALT